MIVGRVWTVGLGVSLVFVVTAPTWATVIAETRFDSGLEGWTKEGDGTVTWQSSGGNPDGYLRAVDPAQGPDTRAIAPAEFLGDWSHFDGTGYLSADLKIISGSQAGIHTGPRFIISGPGGEAVKMWQEADAPYGYWDTFSVDIMESEWDVTSGTWDALLSDVTGFRVKMEFITGVETTGLDNVMLVPEPAALSVMALGGVALLFRRKQREA